MNNFARFTGKTVLITCGGAGMGRAIAIRFAHEGADIAIADIDLDAANKVSDEIKKMGRNCVVHEADISDSKQVGEMVDAAIKKFKKIDFLVNAAGIFFDKPIQENDNILL